MNKVPRGWSNIKLNEVIETIESGSRPKGGASEDVGVPSFGGENILMNGGIKYSPVKTVPSSFFTNMKKGILRHLDVLINKDGANTGKVGIYKNSPFSKACINEHLFILRGRKNYLSQEFLFYFLLSPIGSKRVKDKIIGSAQPGLGSRFINGFPILLPPLEEQEAIAEVLGSVDDAIEATRKVIEQTRTLKKALMQQLLTRGIPGRHKRFKQTPLGEIPETWEVVTIGDAGDWFSGGTPTKSVERFWNGEIQWVCPRDMKQSHVTRTEYSITPEGAQQGSRIVPNGSIFIVVRGMILAHTLPVTIATSNCAFNQDVKALQVNNDFYNEFIRHYMERNSQRLLDVVDESSHGTKRLQTEALFSYPLLKPDLAEQKEISSLIISLEKKVSTSISKVNSLTTLKTALMKALLSGEKRIPKAMLQKGGA